MKYHVYILSYIIPYIPNSENNVSAHLFSWLLQPVVQIFTCVHISSWDDKGHLSSVRQRGLISQDNIYMSSGIYFSSLTYCLLKWRKRSEK